MVPGAGIEPARLAAGDFESPASTNFTTRARTSMRLISFSSPPLYVEINFEVLADPAADE